MLTPSPGWTIADQVSHLAHNDDASVRAATRPQDFAQDAYASPDEIAARYRDRSPAALLDWFTSARRALLATFGVLEPRAGGSARPINHCGPSAALFAASDPQC